MTSNRKPGLVLLPGLMCDAEYWESQRPTLAALASMVYVPSYGALDSISSMAEHVLQTAPAGRLAVVGHSMGGRIALEMARLAPGRLERLALLDTGYQPLAAGQAGLDEAEGRHRLLKMARTNGMAAMARDWARGMVHPRRVDTLVFEAIVGMISRKTPDVFEAQIRALLSRPDATSVLSELKCPTLLACGRQDLWSPLARHEQMHAAIAHSELTVIEDAGHMTSMEQPAAVTQALVRWLQVPSNEPGQVVAP